MKTLSVVATLILLLGAGCTTARVRYQYDQAEQYVYARPIQQIWPQVRTYVFEKGWKVRDKSDTDAQFYYETSWVEDPVAGQRKRYLIQGTQVSADKSRISINTITENKEKTWSVPGRDSESEWELLNRIDPAGAAKILAESDKISQ